MNNIQQQIVQDKRAPRLFTTSNGIVLRIRAVPSHVTREVLRQLKEPRVPTWHNAAKERDEENPLDPDYIEAVAEFKNKQVDLTNRAYLLHTHVNEPDGMPDDVEGPEGTEWSDFQELLGITVHSLSDKRERYIDWLKFHILTDADFRDLMTAIYVAGGLVSEEDVKAAVDSFPDNKNGAALTIVPTEQ